MWIHNNFIASNFFSARKIFDSFFFSQVATSRAAAPLVGVIGYTFDIDVIGRRETRTPSPTSVRNPIGRQGEVMESRRLFFLFFIFFREQYFAMETGLRDDTISLKIVVLLLRITIGPHFYLCKPPSELKCTCRITCKSPPNKTEWIK